MVIRRGKAFYFPDNVDSSYDVFWGLTLREIVYYLLPTVIIGLIFIALPPVSIVWVASKLCLVLFTIVIVIALLASRPVKTRPNIRFGAYIKFKRDYRKRQKLYYLKPRAKRERDF